MKIADVSEFYSPAGGGVRNYVEQKFQASARHGHNLVVIAPGTEDRVERRESGKIIWLATPQLPFDPNYRMFWRAHDVWRVLDAEAPDLVEGSSPWRGGWLVAQWPGAAAKILFMHQDPIAVYPQTLLAGLASPAAIDRAFGWFWSYLRRLSAAFDGCVVAGEWLATRFARHGLRNLHVVPFGVTADEFGPLLRNTELRRSMISECGLDPTAALLINVGRHHPEKRVGMLIDAVVLAQRERPVGLYVVGDGLIHRWLQAKAAHVRHVHLAGRIDDRGLLARMFASADALVHGSTAETFGFAVAEALRSGTPLIVPSAGGAGDLAGGAYSETYVPGDARAASAAILRLLARDRTELSAAAVEGARQHVGDIENHFAKLFDLYVECVSMKRAASVGAGFGREFARKSA